MNTKEKLIYSLPGTAVLGDEGDVEKETESDNEADWPVHQDPFVHVYHTCLLAELVQSFNVSLRFDFTVKTKNTQTDRQAKIQIEDKQIHHAYKRGDGQQF